MQDTSIDTPLTKTDESKRTKDPATMQGYLSNTTNFQQAPNVSSNGSKLGSFPGMLTSPQVGPLQDAYKELNSIWSTTTFALDVIARELRPFAKDRDGLLCQDRLDEALKTFDDDVQSVRKFYKEQLKTTDEEMHGLERYLTVVREDIIKHHDAAIDKAKTAGCKYIRPSAALRSLQPAVKQ